MAAALLDTWTLVGFGVAFVGVILAELSEDKKPLRTLGRVLNWAGLLMALIAFFSDLHRAQEAQMKALTGQVAAATDAVESLLAIQRCEAIETFDTAEKFHAVKLRELAKTRDRVLSLRTHPNQHILAAEKEYFDRYREKVVAGAEAQRIVFLPNEEMARLNRRLIDEFDDRPNFKVFRWDGSPASSMEFIVFDECVVLVAPAVADAGPPSRGFVLHGKAVADLYATEFQRISKLPQAHEIKGQGNLSSETRNALKQLEQLLRPRPDRSSGPGPSDSSPQTSTQDGEGETPREDVSKELPVVKSQAGD